VSLKTLSAFLYFTTGLYTGLCGLYVVGAYASGLPVGQWSSGLVGTWLAASAVTLLAGILAVFLTKGAAMLALVGNSALALLFIFGLAATLKDLADSLYPGAGFEVSVKGVVCGVLVPLLLVISSLLVAFKVYRGSVPPRTTTVAAAK
jgi:hypothetical protein